MCAGLCSDDGIQGEDNTWKIETYVDQMVHHSKNQGMNGRQLCGKSQADERNLFEMQGDCKASITSLMNNSFGDARYLCIGLEESLSWPSYTYPTIFQSPWCRWIFLNSPIMLPLHSWSFVGWEVKPEHHMSDEKLLAWSRVWNYK